MPDFHFQYPATIDDYISQLTAARNYVYRAVDAISNPIDSRPAADRWSPLEVLYHLYLTERRILTNLRKTSASSERHERKHDRYLLREWEAIIKVASDRETRFTAPSALEPNNAPTLEEIRPLLDETRERVIEFVRGSSIDDLASFSMPHPAPEVGNLTGVGWLAILVMHDVRHGRQIEEIGPPDGN